jgi:hypothetical protein
LKAAFLSFNAEGGTMFNTNNFDTQTRQVLDSLGAEPLAGSGFEDEIPELDFAEAEE